MKMVCACLLLIALVLYIFFDVNYFLRVAFEIGLGRIFKKKKNVLETTEIYGFCTTQDLDIFMRHMNNARFIRELDFARFDFYVRTGLYKEMQKVDGHALQGACSIRYRRPVGTFTFYKVTTRLIYWDDKNIYFEHCFVSFDDFVRAIVLTKQNTINFTPSDLIKKLVKDKYQEPKIPQELSEWLGSVETLSAKLRKSD